MESKEKAQEAVDKLNGHILDGRKIRVKLRSRYYRK
jgi:RNA recognition motif-containing protein